MSSHGSASHQAFEIERFTGVCAATGSPLVAGEPCMVALMEREGDEGFERRDYTPEGWESIADPPPPGLFSFWKSTVPEPSQKKRIFVDDDLLLNIFERLEGDVRPQRTAFRFVIALILMRKKILRFVERGAHEGHDAWFFRPKGQSADEGGPTIAVIDPHLSDTDVRGVSDQLGEILNGAIE